MMLKLTILVATTLLAGTVVHAQIPEPNTGDGGMLFAAWDENVSYTYYWVSIF